MDMKCRYIYGLLTRQLNKNIFKQNISTLIQVKPAQLYMSELWPLLLSAQNVSEFRITLLLLRINNLTPIESTNQSPMGIPVAMVEAKKREILARQANRSERDKIAATIDNTVNKVNGKFLDFINVVPRKSISSEHTYGMIKMISRNSIERRT